MRRWLPQPGVSAALIVVWLLLNDSPGWGDLLMGAVLGLLVPLFSHRFAVENFPLRRPWLGARLALIVLWDILVANLIVARLILRPRLRLRPAFVKVPIDLRGDAALAALLGAISITPGTVSVSLNQEGTELMVHALDVADPAELVKQIKSRYERPLMEIFGC